MAVEGIPVDFQSILARFQAILKDSGGFVGTLRIVLEDYKDFCGY